MKEFLTLPDKAKLAVFISDRPQEFKLKYSSKRDGCTANSFHENCDGLGPTVTVAYNKYNTVFGGFTSESWTSPSYWGHFDDSTCGILQSDYVPDPSAFLFQLKKDGVSCGRRFACIEPDKAIHCDKNHAAIFGAGPDLDLFSGAIEENDDMYKLNGIINFSSYDMGGLDVNGFSNGCLQVKDIQVYKVTDAKPWRDTVDWSTPDETARILKSEIESYVPIHEDLSGQNVRFPHCNILLMGPVGAGKSSFLNTVTSVFRGKIFTLARSGCADRSLTSKLTRYQIKSKQLLPIKLWDSRGLETDNTMCSENMRFLLEGNLMDKFVFEPKTLINSGIPGFKKTPKLDDKIHCVAIFIDATIVKTMFETMPEVTNNIKEMQKVMNSLDIPQVIILTKVDKDCEHCNKDVSNVYKSQTIEQRVSEVSELFGIPRNQVFPMKSYENEGTLNDSVNILTMYTLKMILDQADAYLYNQYEEIISSKEYKTNKKDFSGDETWRSEAMD